MSEHRRSTLVLKTVIIGGRRTSVRLEPAMLLALYDIARQQQCTLNDLVTEIDRDRDYLTSSLTGAICVYIVEFYRSNLQVRLGIPLMAGTA
jgi:predicted DNA-binding ribbon-helix-helix protein